MYSVLKITDGTTSVNLLNINRGFLLSDWRPSIAPFKGGGVWQSSPLTDGRRLAMRNFDNSIETFELKLRGNDQDGAIHFVQELVTLLEKAVSYWTSDWQREPVWIEARGAQETNSRYAVVKSYTIDALGNPYTQPFFGACNLIAMDDFTLIVERDHWTENSPGNGTCVAVGTLQSIEDTSIVQYSHFHEAATDDDIYLLMEGGVGDEGSDRCYVGVIAPDSIPTESGIRFPSVTVPQGATILSAYLEVVAKLSGSDDDYDMEFVIAGEATNSASAWGHFADIDAYDLFDEYMYRKTHQSTSAVATILSPAGSWHTDLEVQYLYGLEAIVQEIVDRSGWASGNAMAFFVGFKISPDTPVHDTNSRTFYSYDASDPGETEPILHITYRTSIPETTGREATCTGKTYLANKHNYAQISHVYYFNNDAATWSDNIIGHALPKELLPIIDAGAPEVNDEVFFGIISSAETAGPFDSLAFDLVDGYGGDLSLSWFYSQGGGSWGVLGVEGNRNLAYPGESIVWWQQPADWADQEVHGVTGLWVKARVMAIGTSAPYQQNRDIYSVITPYLDIDSLQVPGEIPSLARIEIIGTEHDKVIDFGTSTVIVGLRSKSRGEDFSAYLNMGENGSKQNPKGVTYSSYWGLETADTTTPTGYKAVKSTTIMNDWASIGDFDFDSNSAIQYVGSYHAFLRMKQVGGSVGDIYYRIRYRGIVDSMSSYTDAKNPNRVGDVDTVDLGIFTFGNAYSLSSSDISTGAAITVQCYQPVSGTNTVTFYDLILVPIDEWSGIYHVDVLDWTNTIHANSLLEIDSISSPRGPRALLRSLGESGLENYITSEWSRMSRGGPILQSNSDQRLWFLTSYGSTYYAYRFNTKYDTNIFRNARYLTMRGSA